MGNLNRPSRLKARLSTATAVAAITFIPLNRGSNTFAREKFEPRRLDAIPSFVTPQSPRMSQANSQPIPQATASTRRQIADRVSTDMVDSDARSSASVPTDHDHHPLTAHAGRLFGASGRYRLSVEGDRVVDPVISKLGGAASRPQRPRVESVITEVLDEIGHLAMYIRSPEDKRVKIAIRDAIQRNLHGGDGSNLTEANREIEIRDIFSDILECLERGTHYSYNRGTQRATLKSAGEDSVQGLFSVLASYDPGKMPEVEKIERVLNARHICEYLLSHLERGQHYEIVKIERTKGTKIVLTEEGKSEIRVLTGFDVNNIEQALHQYEVLRAQGLSRKQAISRPSKEFAVNAALADPFQEIEEESRDWMATVSELAKENKIDHLRNYDTKTVQLTERGIGQVCHHLRVGNLGELARNAQAQIEKAIAEVAFKKQDETEVKQPEVLMDAEDQEELKVKEKAAEELARLVRTAVKATLRKSHIAKRAARRSGSKILFSVDASSTAEPEQARPSEAETNTDIATKEAANPSSPDSLEAIYADEIAAKENGKGDGVATTTVQETDLETIQLAALQAVYPEAFNPRHPRNLKPNGAGARNAVDYEDCDIPPAAGRQAAKAALRFLN